MRTAIKILGLAMLVLPGALDTPRAGAADDYGSFDDAVVSHPSEAAPASDRTRVESIRQEQESRRAPGASLVRRVDLGPVSGDPISRWGPQAGAGAKVGIIDFFDPVALATQFATGELVSIPTNHRACFESNGTPCPFGGPGSRHGNAVAEIVADNAPGASLFLAEVGGGSGYYAAIDWFAANGVSIINHSLVGVYDGPGDGSGPSAAIVDYAVSKGIAWFNTAGDAAPNSSWYTSYQGGYWRGLWNDPDNDRWLNFRTTDEYLGTYCGALMGVRWSDWGVGKTDYDLYISDQIRSTGAGGSPVLASAHDQIAGAAPLEANDFRWLCNTDALLGPVYDKNKDGFVNLMIRRKSTSAAASAVGDLVEIQVVNGWFEYSMAPASAAIAFADSRNRGAASVGSTGGYSGNGPTNDNRSKPDFITDMCAATSVYGPCKERIGFYSNDAATARATGAAAVVRGAFGAMEPWQLVQYLRNSAVLPWDPSSGASAPVVPNNTIGYGVLTLHGYGPPVQPFMPAMFAFVGGRIIDTRVASRERPTTAPIPPNGVYTFDFDGSNAPRPNGSVMLNVTITQAVGRGYVQVSPNGWSIPGTTSALNVEQAGQTVANVVVTPLGPNGDVTFYLPGGGHLVVDFIGQFDGPVSSGQRDMYLPLDPFRAYDSTCAGCGQLVGGVPRDVKVAGIGSATDGWATVPALGVSAVAVSVTADSPTAKGFISAVSTSVAPPMPTSTANYQTGRSVTGVSVVPVDAQGNIRIYASATTHVQVDVLGYFSPFGTSGFIAAPPFRAVDTRRPVGAPRPAASALTVADVTVGGVPVDASAIVGNLTTTSADAIGTMRIGRSSAAVSGAYANSSISAPGQVVATSVLSALDRGKATIIATSAAHRILDVSGWFAPLQRSSPGDVVAVPSVGPSPSLVRAPQLSPDGTKVLYNEGAADGVPRLVMWNRVTGTTTVYDVTEGDGVAGVQPLAISNDGERVAFSTEATNITSEGVGGTFVLDSSTSTIVRVNKLPEWPMFNGTVRFDAEVRRVAISSPWGYVWTLDLSTQVSGLLTDVNFEMHGEFWISARFDAVLMGRRLWREGHGVVILPEGTNLALSDDGRYVVFLASNAAYTRDVFYLYDSDTGSTTRLCEQYRTYPVPVIDLSLGPPPVGDWCGSWATRVVSANGAAPPLYSWTGLMLLRSDFNTPSSWITARAGVIAYSTDAANILPGYSRGWIYIDARNS